MKKYDKLIKIPITWTFTSDGQTLRSTTIGPYQMEINKSDLIVITHNDGIVHKEYVKSRSNDMKRAESILIKLLG